MWFFKLHLRVQATQARTEAINSLTGIGVRLQNTLDKKIWYANPLCTLKTCFTSSVTLSKDPCKCPTLFFHNRQYFDLVSLLGREPTVVMPILQYKITVGEAIALYSNDEVTENGKTRKRVTRNQFNTSLHCIIEVFITNMMKKVKRKRLDTAKRLCNEEGRVPTPNKYRNMPVTITLEHMGR